MSTEMDLLKQEIERAMDNAPLQKALIKDTTLKLCGKRFTK